MSSAPSQTVRTLAYNEANYNNPSHLTADVKPSRILVNNVNPIDTTGSFFDYYINSTTGDLFYKGQSESWGSPIYNFDTGGGSVGLTNIENIGEGVNIFKQIVGGNTAQLRTLTSAGNQIDIATDTPIDGSLELSMSDAYKPVLLSNIVDNVTVTVSLSSNTFDPNGLLGAPAYLRGSLYIQVGTFNTLWACQNETTKVWNKVSGSGAGISSITNIGSGLGIFKDLSSPGASGENANLKKITDTTGKTVFVDMGDYIRSDMADEYVPVALDKLYNIQDNRTGVLSNPTVNDDSSAGWTRGSLWIEQEITGVNKIFICNSASIGSADWRLYNPSASMITYDWANWAEAGGNPQVISPAWADMNLGPNPNPPALAQAPISVLSALFDGSRTVFRRGVVTSAKSYRVTFAIICRDFAASTLKDGYYDFRLVRKSDGFAFTQSIHSFTIPVHSTSGYKQSASMSFIIDEPSLSQEEYYWQIQGLTGNPLPIGTAQNINIDQWNMSMNEL